MEEQLMNYTDCLDFLYSQLPMYQRVGGAAYKADLSNTIELARICGNPERELKCVHIAGTNGKGSVSSLVASSLQAAGYKVGLYTSPHLKDFRERIRVDGEMISKEFVCAFVENHKVDWERIQPSFFEITVMMAFDYFRYQKIDIAVIETGMGGRLDSTNIVSPEVTTITNISLDHQQFLGDTIAKIAREKAGIIKDKIPTVVGELHPEALQVISEFAAQKESELIVSGAIDIRTPNSELEGPFQAMNKKVAMLTLKELKKKGWAIESDHLVTGFLKVKENTGLRGRWEVIDKSPLTIADGAHNVDGIKWVLKGIEEYEYDHLHIVLGVSADKDLTSILPLFPKEAIYYFSRAQIQRAMDPHKLREQALEYGLKGEVFDNIGKAYQAARLYAGSEDLIFIGGSLFAVAEIL